MKRNSKATAGEIKATAELLQTLQCCSNDKHMIKDSVIYFHMTMMLHTLQNIQTDYSFIWQIRHISFRFKQQMLDS